MKQKTGRKLLSFLLTLAMLVGLMPGMSLTALADDTELAITGGDSTTNITWAQFVENVNNGTTYEGQTVKLLKDISVNNKINIGKPFNGTFDGDGHTMIVDFEYGNVTGAALFPRVGDGKSITVKNLTLGGKISGGQHTAGIVGSLSGNNNITTVSIDNVIIVADISQTSSHVGGFVGHAGGNDGHQPNTIDINNCHFLGKLSRSAGDGSCTGGIVGWRDGSTAVSISDSSFGGIISDNTGYFNPWVLLFHDTSYTYFTTSGSLTTNRDGKNGSGNNNVDASYPHKTASCSNITYNIISEYQYDGSAHGLQISTTAPESGAIITYGTVADKYVYTESPTLTTPGEQTVYYQIACPGYNTVRGSVTVTVGKADQTAPTGLTATKASSNSAADGKISGVTSAMEYQIDGATTWTAVGENKIEITGLTTGTYRVRYAETADKNASPAATVEVGVKVAPIVTAPTAKTLTYNGQAQELVIAGSTEDGTLYYAVTTENVAPTDE